MSSTKAPWWRDPFVVVNGGVSLMVVFCFFAHPLKYVRVTGDCSSNWLFLGAPNSPPVCCDRSNEAPCYPGMHEMHIISTGQAAWVLPLTAVFFNFGVSVFLPSVPYRQVSALFNRLGLYFAIMVFRTVFLYILFNVIEHSLFPRPKSCWYAKYRRNNKCLDGFDHADHIVLYMVHFLAIACFEWKILDKESAHPLKLLFLRGWLLLLALLACYGIYHTAAYFHSAWENVIGMLVAQIFVMYPLYSLAQDNLRQLHPAISLRHFVYVGKAAH
ncbi:unnamed protein product [Aphanomyces euteiches]